MEDADAGDAGGAVKGDAMDVEDAEPNSLAKKHKSKKRKVEGETPKKAKKVRVDA